VNRCNLALFLSGLLCSGSFLFTEIVVAEDHLVGTSQWGQGPGGSSNWGLSYFNLASGEAQRVNEGGASWFSYQYLSFNYRMSWSERFSIRPTVVTHTAGIKDNFGNTRPMESELGDLHLVYSNFNMMSFPGEWDLAGRFFLYLPTSKSSQNKRQIFAIRSWLTFKNVLNRYWTFQYHFEPRYFQQSQKAYRYETVNISPSGRSFNRVRSRLNQFAEVSNRIELERYFNPTITGTITAAFEHEWYHDSEQVREADLSKESFSAGLGAWVNALRSLRFKLSVDSTVNLKKPREEDRLFTDRTTQYVLMTFWTIY
jgi:hypothetical protein